MRPESRTLEVDEDLEFQKREWVAQRVGLGLLYVFVLAAAFGATGMGGVLSRGEAGRREEPLFVEYERFVRRGAASTVRLHLRASPGEVKFWVSAPYFEHVRVESIAPPVQNVLVDGNRHIYTIQSGSGGVVVTLEVEPHSVGTIDGEAGLVGGPAVRFRQLAFF